MGGFVDGCDVSKVLLIEVISCDFLNFVKFVSILLDYKVCDSFKKRGKIVCEFVIDLNKFDVVSVLMDRNIILGFGE